MLDLLDTDWDHMRSPLMLPMVRRKAEAGNGHALLHWFEPDPTAFMRQEVDRSSPRLAWRNLEQISQDGDLDLARPFDKMLIDKWKHGRRCGARCVAM